MPTYLYREQSTGELVELVMSNDEREMSEYGGVITLPDGRLGVRDIVAEHKAQRSGGHGWPKLSYALGCHPNDIPDVQARLRAQGVSADFKTEDGMSALCKLENRAHRKQVCRALGMIDRDGGYGDA